MLANVIHALSKRIKPVTSVVTSPLSCNANYNTLPFNHLFVSCSTLLHLKCIHALILTSGSLGNLLLSTKLVALASQLSPTMDYAQTIFDRVGQKDVFVWNTLIRGYANVGPCQKAVILYRSMHQSGLLPDNYTFPFVIRSCAVISALKEGTEVHCNVIKSGFDVDVFVQSSLVSMYSQAGDIFSTEKVFGEMGVRNIVSWTAMVAGYVQNGLYEQGLFLFKEMICLKAQPNAVTLASVLPACASLEFLDLGKMIHVYGIKVGVDSDTSVINSLIALYGKCGRVDTARALFDGMVVKNLVTWNAMIAAYEHNNAGRLAIKLFRRMLCEKVEYDYITMVSVISACASLGALSTGKWIHQLVKKRELETNVSVSNALTDMYAKCGNIDEAEDVFKKLTKKTVVSWTSIIGALAYHGRAIEALKLFTQMKEEGTRPNGFTFTAILTACRHAGLVEEGKKHFESMFQDYSIVPGIEQCACMVDLLGRAGCLTEAYEFIESMPIQADPSVWGALLGACRIHDNFKLAELVAEKLIKLDPQDITPYVIMSHIYCNAGRSEDVSRLRNLMRERELKKLPAHSLVEANRRLHRFLVDSRPRRSWPAV
ncbi:Pentatricopeptide repeat-containing protein At1g08070, chloroplastic [Linum grandiflorum]